MTTDEAHDRYRYRRAAGPRRVRQQHTTEAAEVFAMSEDELNRRWKLGQVAKLNVERDTGAES